MADDLEQQVREAAQCTECDGTGDRHAVKGETFKCPVCGGAGGNGLHLCDLCFGDGFVKTLVCDACDGGGYVRPDAAAVARALEATIEASYHELEADPDRILRAVYDRIVNKALAALWKAPDA